MVSGGRPSAPCTCVIQCESRPPTVRLTLRTRNSPVTGRRWSIASLDASISFQSSAPGSGESCGRTRRSGVPSGTSGIESTWDRSTPRAFQWPIASAASSRAGRPTTLAEVGAADQLGVGADAEPRHDPPRLLGDEEQVVDDVLGRPLEALAQHRIL